MREAVAKLAAKHPGLEVEGEMHADSAISEVVRNRTFPNSRLQGAANLLVMPTLDSANVAFNLLNRRVVDFLSGRCWSVVRSRCISLPNR